MKGTGRITFIVDENDAFIITNIGKTDRKKKCRTVVDIESLILHWHTLVIRSRYKIKTRLVLSRGHL